MNDEETKSERVSVGKVEVDVKERSDGGMIIQNKAPLADGPANLCAWLHQHAAATPDKHFLLERSPSGQWAGVTYAEALSRVHRNIKEVKPSIHSVGQPFLLEVVPAEIHRTYLTCLVYPNIQVIRKALKSTSEVLPDDDAFVQSAPVADLFRSILKKHNDASSGTSWRIERLIVLNEQPRIDKNETTDKGCLNQNAVLAHHKDPVADLYADPPPAHVIEVDG